jgi:hypothetical protein
VKHFIRTIVSGGQTGVDRAALDFAIACGIPYDGWLPAGRKAEDGQVPRYYKLRNSAMDYQQRTQRNVDMANATVVFFHDKMTPGSSLTYRYAHSIKKPCMLLDCSMSAVMDAAKALLRFTHDAPAGWLNVAGSRESKWPDGYAYVLAVLTKAQILYTLG